MELKMYDPMQYKSKTTASPFMQLDWVTSKIDSIGQKYIRSADKIVERGTSLQVLAPLVAYDYKMAIKIEAGIFEFSVVYTVAKDFLPNMITVIYKEKLRDLIININPNTTVANKTLRQDLLNGELVAQHLAFMEPHELHPKHWEKEIKKKELREYKKKNMAATDAYKCRKCGERRCKVMQMQTRSADEPMTNFATCLNCHTTFKC